VGAGLGEVEVLEVALLVRIDDVANVGLQQGCFGHRQQAIGIGG